MSSPFALSTDHLGHLTPLDAVLTFRDLLWAQARRRGVPITAVDISERIHEADGGVDAAVADDALAVLGADELLDRGTGFQIKTGTDCAPWKPSWVHKELFGRKKAARKENLGSSVRSCLDRGRRYVLVCFGADPPAPKRRAARKHLIDKLRAAGYKRPRVAVWFQDHVIGLLQPYPSLCLRIAGREEWGLLPHAAWAQDADMQTPFHLGPEQEGFISDVRSCLRGNEVRHVRVVGEPGIGKSRLVLEATSASDLAPLVVYVPDAETFRTSPLFGALRQADNSFSAVIVIDSCPPSDRAEIWNGLRGRSDRVRLVTLDDGPEDAGDRLMRVFNAPALNRGQISAIIADYTPSSLEVDRWARSCAGSPRVAHVVGLNLRDHPEDLLRPPATVPVWDRFLCGTNDPHSERSGQERSVLRCLALFERFGFSGPVRAEADYIQQMVTAVDPSITSPRFCELVQGLRGRGILRGSTTLHLTPRLLHAYLYRDFWETIGPGLDLPRRLGEMPGRLPLWFTRMLRYAHTSPAGLEAVRELLGTRGPFADERFLDSQQGGELLLALAEAEPQATLDCLRRTIGSWPRERLQRFREGRRHAVWALEKLAAWRDCFAGAAGVLLALGEAENETCTNNASGVFAELFRLQPGMAVTQAEPSLRLPVLRAALQSPCVARRRLGVRACKDALETRESSRMVGPEHQGLRPELQVWWPATWGELYDAYREVWQLLAGEAARWEAEERRSVTSVLTEAARGVLELPALTGMVLDTLERFADDPSVDRRGLVESVAHILRYDGDELPDEVRQRLERLDERLRGSNFASRLRRLVTWRLWEDDLDREGKIVHCAATQVEALAVQAVECPEMLAPELPWLVAERAEHGCQFGYALGRLDPGGGVFEPIFRAQLAAGREGTSPFLTGYLAAHFARDPSWWEQAVLRLAREPTLRPLFGELTFRSGLTEAVALHAVEMAERAEIEPQQFRLWRGGRRIRGLLETTVSRLLTALLAENTTESVTVAIELCDAYYCHEEEPAQLPQKLGHDLLTHDALFAERLRHQDASAYHWSRVANRFLDLYPAHALGLLEDVLLRCGEPGSSLLSPGSRAPQVLERIVAENAPGAWDRIAHLVDDVHAPRTWCIQRWLAGRPGFGEQRAGPIVLFPAEVLWAWADQDLPGRARWLAGTLPRTLDADRHGGLTREFLCRYGDREEISLDLRRHFHYSGGWMGSEAEHYRGRREKAQSWLAGETDARVITWLQEYIRWLDADIERADIKEERED